jgi:hypothetical protein
VTRHFPIVFRVHDLRSCMAGKVHAVLARVVADVDPFLEDARDHRLLNRALLLDELGRRDT